MLSGASRRFTSDCSRCNYVGEHRREHCRSGVGHRQRERAPVDPRIEALRLERVLQVVERRSDGGPKSMRVCGRVDANRRRDEKLLVRRLSQAPQCIADRGLRHGQSRRSARDVALHHHDVEDLEEVEVQRSEVRASLHSCVTAPESLR